MTELGDELLVAYVDGQLARKQTRAVEKVLDQDDVLAARVDALKHAHARLEAAFEAILAGEEVDVSAASAPAEDGIVIPWRVAKMALASIGIAAPLALAVVGYGWPLKLPNMLQTTPQAAGLSGDWQADAARAQALLSRQSLEVGLEGKANYDLVAFQLAHILETNLKFPNLQAQGFHFVRAQMLRYGGAPLIQILYLAARDGPLALYAKKGEGSDTLTPGQYGTIRTVTWAEHGVSYLLAGEVDDALLMRIATRVRLEPAPPPRSAPKPYTPVNDALDKSR